MLHKACFQAVIIYYFYYLKVVELVFSNHIVLFSALFFTVSVKLF